MKYLIVAALFGTAFAALAASPGDDDADRAWGKFAWENGDFSHANTLLTRYRTKAGVKQDAEADYMIATSWCRLPGLREKGSALLLWLTKQKDVSPALLLSAQKERKACANADPLTEPPIASGKGAGIKAQGNVNPPVVRNKLPS